MVYLYYCLWHGSSQSEVVWPARPIFGALQVVITFSISARVFMAQALVVHEEITTCAKNRSGPRDQVSGHTAVAGLG